MTFIWLWIYKDTRYGSMQAKCLSLYECGGEGGNVIFQNSTFENSSVLSPSYFWKELTYFSKMRRITHLQISHGTRRNSYLSNAIKNKVVLCCMRPEHYRKERRIGVTQKTVIHPRKPKHALNHSIDRKHRLLYVKLEVGFSISFTRKLVSAKKWHSPPWSPLVQKTQNGTKLFKVSLFVDTLMKEVTNIASNFTQSKLGFLSTERCQGF